MSKKTPEIDRIPDKDQIKKEEEALEKKNKWLYPAVITVLVLFFVGGFIYGLNKVLSMEGAFPEPELVESKTPVPADNEAMVSYLNKLLDDAKKEKPKFTRSGAYRIDAGALELDMEQGGETALRQSLALIAGDVSDRLNSLAFPAKTEGEEKDPNTADFFEGFDGLISDPAFTASDFASDFTCSYIYYKCYSCDKESDTPQDSCAECGSEHEYAMMYRDNYDFSVELNVSENLLSANFFPNSEADIKEVLAKDLEGVADLVSASEDVSALRVKFSVERATDHLLSLVYEKDVTLHLALSFKDAYAALGNVGVDVPATQTFTYSFIWPGLTLNLHKLSVEPKEKGNLLATLSCDDPAQYNDQVVWTSSDESVIKVEEKTGYYTAGPNADGEKTATITATYVFRGHEYHDECEVTVKYAVESMKLNKRSLKLKVNDNAQLTAKVSPKKATVKTAKWASSDDSVVQIVSTDGVTCEIKAVGEGTATVYALSDDGAYRSSCEVTVK